MTKPIIWPRIAILLIAAVTHSLAFSQSLGTTDKTIGGIIQPGAMQTGQYFPMLKGKKVAITANHTSMLGNTHLIDTLLSSGIQVVKVFSPEHGFRGDAPDGQLIDHYKDPITSIPILSLYGKKKKPEAGDLSGVDIMVFDMQDVGVRFYTYISTMAYVMEACADAGIPVIILDRPNPNGHYIDGPILESSHRSFVGLHPVPIVYGMTIGEYARMLVGESWLECTKVCDLKVIPVAGYNHRMLYHLPIPPSPNLPNMASVYLYPSLALFEGTVISIGRGTDFPFQVIGHPRLKDAPMRFRPRSIPHASKNPPHKDVDCFGYPLADFGIHFAWRYRHIYLFWLQESYKQLGHEDSFFTPYFEKLAGTSTLREQIIEGKTEEEIRRTWENGLTQFKIIRKKYLLYPDFEP